MYKDTSILASDVVLLAQIRASVETFNELKVSTDDQINNTFPPCGKIAITRIFVQVRRVPVALSMQNLEVTKRHIDQEINVGEEHRRGADVPRPARMYLGVR